MAKRKQSWFAIGKQIHRHHISYVMWPNTTVELQSSLHRVISTIQNTPPTPEFNEFLKNLVMSLNWEWVVHEMDLKTKEDGGEQ